MIEYKTRAITITLRPNGIIHVSNNEDWNELDTLESTQENITLLKEVFDGQPDRCLLFEMPNRHVRKELLDCYQRAEWGEVAIALLLTSYGAKIVGNLYLKLSKNKPNEAGRVVPTKLFSNEEIAETWLLEQVKAQKNK